MEILTLSFIGERQRIMESQQQDRSQDQMLEDQVAIAVSRIMANQNRK